MRLGQEAEPGCLFEMAVEVAREQTLERPVLEREVERIAGDERGGGDALAGDREHPFALVEPGHVARQMLGDETGAAGDVERLGGRQRCQGTVATSASSSSQPGLDRSLYRPTPSHQSSYSGARVS